MGTPLEEVIGYQFKDPGRLQEALTHKSHAAESRSGVDNERLEFLGDSVLSAVIAHRLYLENPKDPEGALSQKKSWLVSRPNLARWAAKIDLGSSLRLGAGEEASGGRTRPSVLGNALEALIGAVYLDGGYEKARLLVGRLTDLGGVYEGEDYKSRLQEILQKKYKTVPAYEIVNAVGPEHDKTFEVRVRLGRKILGEGSGKNKKEAEQAAAQAALEKVTQKQEE